MCAVVVVVADGGGEGNAHHTGLSSLGKCCTFSAGKRRRALLLLGLQPVLHLAGKARGAGITPPGVSAPFKLTARVRRAEPRCWSGADAAWQGLNETWHCLLRTVCMAAGCVVGREIELWW